MRLNHLQYANSLYAKMFPTEIQLTSVKAVARVSDDLASVRVEQTYRNTTDALVEGVYQFPVFANAVVTGCRFVLPDETVTCVVEESSEAKKPYNDALESGKQAVLAGKLSDELYEMNVGGVPPHAEVRVELDYATLVKQDFRNAEGVSYRLTIPTTIADWRYSNQFDAESPKPTFVTGGVGGSAPKLSIEVFLESSCRIKRMKCANDYDCELSFDGSSGTVTFSQDSLAMNRDFVFTYSTCGATCIVERGDGEYAMLVNASELFKPSSAARPGTYVFIVDQSGSMASRGGVFRNGRWQSNGNSPMKQARDAAMLMVKSLNEGCRFNVYGFGSSYYSVFDEPVAYAEDSCAKAVERCRGMEANMGGTELRSVVDDVLRKLPAGDCFVFLLTDCGVYDIDGIKGIVRDRKRNKKDFCLSVLSIGDNVGYDLSEGVARMSGGLSKTVSVDEDITRKTLALFNGTLNFSCLEVSIDLGTGPQQLDLQLDTTYYDFVPATSADSATILVTRSDGLVETATVPVKYVAPDPRQQDLHCVVADAKIRRMTARNDIVSLSKRYGIVSKYTSFVGVSDADLEIVGGSGDSAPRERKRVMIPLQSSSTSYTTGALVVAGGCGISKHLLCGGGSPLTLASAALTPATFGASTLSTNTVSCTNASSFTSLACSSLSPATCSGGTGASSYSTGDMIIGKKMMKRPTQSSGRSRSLETSLQPSSKVDAQSSKLDFAGLLALQNFNGSFELADVERFGRPLSKDLLDFLTDDLLVRRLVATLAVLDLLVRKKATESFRFVFEKARAFVLANAPADSKLRHLLPQEVVESPEVF